MNRQRANLVTLVSLITLVITPAAVAKIYKCDGPDGPVYSDRECGPDAANVELLESSGLSGVSEQDKSTLAEKKLERELEREQTRNRNQQESEVNYQNNTYTTENPGRWVRDGNRLRNRDNANTLPAKPLPAKPLPAKPLPAKPLPAKPLPVTLPAIPRKKR